MAPAVTVRYSHVGTPLLERSLFRQLKLKLAKLIRVSPTDDRDDTDRNRD